MQWRGRRGSSNISRRSGTGRAVGGIGGIAGVAILLLGWYFGVDTSGFVDLGGGSVQSQEVTPQDEERGQFVSVVLADTEEVWAEVFRTQVGEAYDEPQLVLFKGAVRSGCGDATAQTGPFYCPNDRTAYLDTDFFVTMERQLGAGGDFAAAYVVAHEVAHHVQNELGILGQVNQMRAQVGQEESNALSVRTELQADCYSGIWARQAQAMFGSLEPGDVEEAMNAAAQIGDDTLQRNAGQVVRPHTFTHGTSAQRQRWFARGFDSGDLTQCDTFSATQL